MNAYPPLGPLEPRHVKELVKQIRALRFDNPSLSVDELAAEWEENQRWRIGEHRPTPFADFIEDADWPRHFARAHELAVRAADRTAQQRELRQKAKETKKAWEAANPRPPRPKRPKPPRRKRED